MTILRIITVYLIFAFPMPAATAENSVEAASRYNIVIDEQNNVILETGVSVAAGDQFIAEDDRLFEITSVEGTLARARFQYRESAVPASAATPIASRGEEGTASAQQMLIGICHTRADESYIPTDGAATLPGEGGILQVGKAFTERLQALGYRVEHDATLHNPPDANAEQQSRRTFATLLEHRPAAVFDIHRDSAPGNLYNTVINGQPTAKILLVVGRQNQNRETLLAYAQRIKNAADARYPHLIRGILIAHGNYNQDLSPRAMLLEVGTQFNSRFAAERSVAFFADTVPAFLDAASSSPLLAGAAQPFPAVPPTLTGTEAVLSGSPWTDSLRPYRKELYLLFTVLTFCLAAYMLLRTNSGKEAERKLQQFAQAKFTSFWGPRCRRK